MHKTHLMKNEIATVVANRLAPNLHSLAMTIFGIIRQDRRDLDLLLYSSILVNFVEKGNIVTSWYWT